MGNKIQNPSLFKQVSIENFNDNALPYFSENGVAVVPHVIDKNGNGIVDHQDTFFENTREASPDRKNAYLHAMCIERFTQKTRGHITEAAKAVIARNRGDYHTIENVYAGVIIDLGVFPKGIHLIKQGIYILLGETFSGISVQGGYDPELKGCHYNTRMEISKGPLKNQIRLQYENATGPHEEVWNLRTDRKKIKR